MVASGGDDATALCDDVCGFASEKEEGRAGGRVTAEAGADPGDAGDGKNSTGPSSGRQLLLFTTYTITMFGINAAPLLYPAMESSGIFDAATATRILGIQTGGTALGKFFAGPVADVLGGRRTYLLSVCLLGGFILLLSFASSAWLVGLCAFCMEFFNTPMYPAHARIIRSWYAPERVSSAFWILGMASRGGNLGAGILYGVFVYKGMSWRWVLRLAAILCVAGGILSRLHRDSPAAANAPGATPDLRSLRKTGRRIVTHPHFWVAASSCITATIAKRMGQEVPVFLYSNAPSVLDKGTAASVAVVFQLGLLVSVAGGGAFYRWLRREHRTRFLVSLNCVSCAAAAVLSVASSFSCTSISCVVLKCFLLFCIAGGIGCSYYIPTGMFAVRFGGQESTGTVSAFMDMVSWSISAVFLVMLSWVIEGPLAWPGVWGLVAADCALCAYASLKFHRLLLSDDIKPLEDCEHVAYAALSTAPKTSRHMVPESAGGYGRGGVDALAP